MPLQISYLNQYLLLNPEIAAVQSPVFLKPVTTSPIILAVGEKETNEFRDQSRELQHSWEAAGVPISVVEIPGCNHFSIVGDMVRKHSVLQNILLQMMGVGSQ